MDPGSRDGVLVCETCQGQGIVATKPGGAGVPFYIGNAQCSSCKGLGFEPCPVCVGYEAKLPPPDPCNGPASHDTIDSLVTSQRWLASFPDSRSKRRAKRPARKALQDSHKVPAHELEARKMDWEALAKHFYVMHGAKRSGC